jgi:hypothetical protein
MGLIRSVVYEDSKIRESDNVAQKWFRHGTPTLAKDVINVNRNR